jgi:hypothetical protein
MTLLSIHGRITLELFRIDQMLQIRQHFHRLDVIIVIKFQIVEHGNVDTGKFGKARTGSIIQVKHPIPVVFISGQDFNEHIPEAVRAFEVKVFT